VSGLRRFFTRLLGVMTMLRSGEQPGDERLKEEMESHIAAQADENTRVGMTPQEANRRARLRFGAVQVVRESYHAEECRPFVEIFCWTFVMRSVCFVSLLHSQSSPS
jgi:hypothetical protein